MEDDLRPVIGDRLEQVVVVADVAAHVGDMPGQPGRNEVARLRRRLRVAIANDVGAQFEQPGCEPGAFEAGVAGDEYGFA